MRLAFVVRQHSLVVKPYKLCIRKFSKELSNKVKTDTSVQQNVKGLKGLGLGDLNFTKNIFLSLWDFVSHPAEIPGKSRNMWISIKAEAHHYWVCFLICYFIN